MNIRDIILSLRRIMSVNEKRTADKIIYEKVVERHEWRKAEIICLYMSTAREVDTKPLLATALNAEKTIVFPRVENNRLILHQITSITQFTRGAYQQLEPIKSTRTVDPKLVDLFIVPGVAFDYNLNRLGRGKGYYDKLLSVVSAPKIGLAYAIQMVAKVPHTSYDVRMTMVITEEENICQS